MQSGYIVEIVFGIVLIFSAAIFFVVRRRNKRYEETLNIVENIKLRANLILQDNQQILSPILADRPNIKRISTSMNSLFNLQQSRADFGEWKSQVETFEKEEFDKELKKYYQELLKVLNELQEVLYSNSNPNGLEGLKSYSKKYVLKGVLEKYISDGIEPNQLKLLKSHVNDYLENLRRIIEEIGSISGKLKGRLNEFSSSGIDKNLVTKNGNSDNIITALIGLVGTIILVYFGYLQSTAVVEIPIHATQTAEARLSAIANAITVTAISAPTLGQVPPIPTTITLLPTATSPLVIPTETSFPTPTPTEQPTNTPPVPTSTPEIIFQEQFLNNQNRWPIISNGVTTQKILGGKLQQTTKCPVSYSAYFCGSYLLVPTTNLKDFLFSFDVTMDQLESGDDVAIGLQFRRTGTGSNFYFANFHLTGAYILQMIKDQKTDTLFDGNNRSVINTGVGNSNTFSILANNYTLTLLANGSQLKTIDDGNLAGSGQLYLVISISKGGNATISIDNVMITKP